MVEGIEAGFGGFETIVDRVIGELVGRKRDRSLAVLDPGKAFFLGRRDHLSIPHETGSRIMESRVDAECVHKPQSDKTVRADNGCMVISDCRAGVFRDLDPYVNDDHTQYTGHQGKWITGCRVALRLPVRCLTDSIQERGVLGIVRSISRADTGQA